MPPARPPSAPATRLSQAGDISSKLLTTSSEPETTSSELLTTFSNLLTTFSGSYRPTRASVPSDTCIRTFRYEPAKWLTAAADIPLTATRAAYRGWYAPLATL